MAELTCERCGRPQPANAELKQCVYCGAALSEKAPDLTPVPVPVPAPEAPAPTAPAATPAAPADLPVPEGKRRCPGCGELLYAEEKRCWRCGAELAAPPEAAAAPAPPPLGPAPVTPVAPPSVAAPGAPVAAPPAPVPPPYVPPAASAPPAAPVDPAAQTLGIWALVLSLLGLLCCPPVIPSIIAIVLGMKAKGRGAAALAIAGIVIGIIGLLVWIPVVAIIILGVLSPSTTSHTPEATSWLGSVPWLFT